MADDPGSTSVPADARSRWVELVDAINQARSLYYQQDAPTLSDDEYDALFRELVALEQAWPELQSGESPTQTVGGARAEMFDPVRHLQRLYSLDNAFDEGELRAWLDRVEKGLGEVPDLLCELKIDGLAVDAVYVDGRLTTLATRGDGRVGEDVTYNATFIASVPQRLASASGQPVPRLLEVRGEVFLPVAEFERINSEQQDLGMAAFANPRNAAAGGLRQRVDRRETELASARKSAGGSARSESKIARMDAELGAGTQSPAGASADRARNRRGRGGQLLPPERGIRAARRSRPARQCPCKGASVRRRSPGVHRVLRRAPARHRA